MSIDTETGGGERKSEGERPPKKWQGGARTSSDGSLEAFISSGITRAVCVCMCARRRVASHPKFALGALFVLFPRFPQGLLSFKKNCTYLSPSFLFPPRFVFFPVVSCMAFFMWYAFNSKVNTPILNTKELFLQKYKKNNNKQIMS